MYRMAGLVRAPTTTFGAGAAGLYDAAESLVMQASRGKPIYSTFRTMARMTLRTTESSSIDVIGM